MAKKAATLPDAVWERVRDPARRAVVASLGGAEGADDTDFANLTRLARSAFGAPVALVSLVDLEHQWFRAGLGIAISETPIGMSFCAHAIAADDRPVLVIPDMEADPRFASNPLVTGDDHVRFYAGAPITVRGQKIGTVCVLDRVARHNVSQDQLDRLVDMANLAGTLFALKDDARVRARTAAELIREEWRHALTLEAGHVGSWVWDLRSNEVIANDIMRGMFGLEASGTIEADQIFAAMQDADRPAVNAALAATFKDGIDYVSEFQVNSGHWLSGRGRVYQRDADGKPLIMMGVNIDITEAREAADQTRRLLRELNHRVKNTLAMIEALARQTSRQSVDPQHFVEDFSGRLRTLSDAHALLSERDWTGIGLMELIVAQLTPYLSHSAQLVMDGRDLRLPPDHALGLGLVLHELSSNAAKYGSLSRPAGKVKVQWHPVPGDERRINLIWTEIGGPEVADPGMAKLGRRLIERSLDKVLDSRVMLQFPKTGVIAEISFPLE